MRLAHPSWLLAAAFIAACPLHAQVQNSEVITVASDKFLRWYGHANRTYFIQISDPNDHLRKWTWAPVIETGNNSNISHEVGGTANNGFFRLWFSDEPTNDPDGDDFDYDGLTNLSEVTTHQTNPLMWDTDNDGLSDTWEITHGLDPNDDGSINPDNGADGDPDGDGLVNLMESWYYADPNLVDTDGDGLNDYDEAFVHGTWPDVADIDGDGLNDYDEIITYNTDPWIGDMDDDTLTDGEEVLTHSTNPKEMDTDGDWMWDDWELANNLDPTNAADGLLDADGDTLANKLEFVFMDKGYDPVVANNAAEFPWTEDPDGDDLNTQIEFVTHQTHPRQPDTDGDSMNDGWELANGFNAKLNNRVSGPANHHPDADLDGDGLTNAEEEQYATKPNNADSDGDGVDDKTEITQGSNPNDPDDKNPPPNGTVPASFTFGDQSGSHSEKYRVQLTPLEGDTQGVRFRTNREYGETEERTFRLPKGAKYKIELLHIGTSPKHRGPPSPDYDYTLEVNDTANCITVVDPDAIMGVHNESYSYHAYGKHATLFVPLFEWVTPKGSPVSAPNNAGDGQNEFTYDQASPGVLTMNLKVLVKPTGTAASTDRYGKKFWDRCIFKLPAIVGSTFIWDNANPGGKSNAVGEHLNAKATYTTLPDQNSSFGLKQAEFECDSDNTSLPKGDFEVFYMGMEKNHAGGDPTHRNWFHYYRLNEGGTGYDYEPVAATRSHSLSAGGDSSIRIADEAYLGDQYLVTTINGAGFLVATGASGTNKYYANFIGVLQHERFHANGQTNAGPPTDRDSDRLSNDFETTISHTDPDLPFSAQGVFPGFADREIWAGGPVERDAIQTANTDQDWANPGTNSK